jgi:small subunit ribosomal protein S9
MPPNTTEITPADLPAAPEIPAAAPASEPAAALPVVGTHLGTGRRKTAVARVRMMPGTGKFLINDRDVEQFFTELQDRNDATAPLDLTGVRRHWDVRVNIAGGGHTGQAGAVRLGLARAVLKAYAQFEITLRDAGYLTRDARKVERKKYGRRKARRRFQFSKR